MSFYRHTLLTILFLVVGTITPAMAESHGERLLRKGDLLRKSYLTDFSSVPRDSVAVTLEKAAAELEKEGNKALLSDALTLLAGIYSEDYRTYNKTFQILNRVLELEPESHTKNRTIATYLKAYLSIWQNPNAAFRHLVTYGYPDVNSSFPLSNLIACVHILANASLAAENIPSANMFFNTIYRSMDSVEKAAAVDDETVVTQIRALTDYVLFLYSQGHLTEALDIIKFSMELMNKRKLTSSLATISILRTYGTFAFYLGQYDDAEKFLDSALQLCNAVCGDTSIEGIECVRVLAEVYGKKGQPAKADRLIENAIRTVEKSLGRNSLAACRLWGARGHIWFSDGDSKEGSYLTAATCYSRAAGISRQIDYYEPQLYVNLSTSYLLAGRLDDALREAGNAVILERGHIHDTFLSLSERGRESYWALHGSTNLRLLTLAAATPEDTGGTLYDIALLSKGLLMDSSSQFLTFIQSQKEVALKEKWQSYLTAQRRLEDYLMDPDKDKSDESALRADLVSREADLMMFAGTVGTYLPGLTSTWKQVADALNEKDVAIEILRYEEWQSHRPRYIASVLQKGQSPVNIPLDGIDEKAIQEMSFDKLYKSTDLFKQLFAPMEKYLANKDNVYFSPAGCFNSLSIENIPSPGGLTMGERWHMHRVSSTRQILLPPSSETWSSAAVFGGFDYNLGLDKMEYYSDAYSERGNANSLRQWQYLPGSLAEANAVSGLLSSIHPKVVRGEEGVEESFKALSGTGTNLIHIATHGYYNQAAVGTIGPKVFAEGDELMESTGLVFSGANNKVHKEGVDEGLLSAKEVSRLNLIGCDLLVLSSCGSGLGVTDSINETYGLLRGFKKAGCRSILMSLWDIDDTASRLFMEYFYRAILKGQDNHHALEIARAQLKARYPDPHYWAPFVLID
jgi:CHAT domain-containing protein